MQLDLWVMKLFIQNLSSLYHVHIDFYPTIFINFIICMLFFHQFSLFFVFFVFLVDPNSAHLCFILFLWLLTFAIPWSWMPEECHNNLGSHKFASAYFKVMYTQHEMAMVQTRFLKEVATGSAAASFIKISFWHFFNFQVNLRNQYFLISMILEQHVNFRRHSLSYSTQPLCLTDHLPFVFLKKYFTLIRLLCLNVDLLF